MNYGGLCDLKRSRSQIDPRRSIPVAMRVLGENHEYTLRLKVIYAQSLFHVNGATVDDLREGVTTLEDTTRIARRVWWRAPITIWVEGALVHTRMAFRIRRACSVVGPLGFCLCGRGRLGLACACLAMHPRRRHPCMPSQPSPTLSSVL